MLSRQAFIRVDTRATFMRMITGITLASRCGRWTTGFQLVAVVQRSMRVMFHAPIRPDTKRQGRPTV